MNYAHRNGETEAPTVAGLYWFDGHRTSIAGNKLHVMDMLEVDKDGCIDPDFTFATIVTSWDGKWWGPIVAPWGVAQ